MDYFAGLDVSMEETHVCVVDRDGAVIHEVKVPSTPADIKTALAGAPACRRVVFETGRMAPMLHHGLTGCGVPVICIESRQARQALKSFATHKPTATMRAAWHISPAPVSSSPFEGNAPNWVFVLTVQHVRLQMDWDNLSSVRREVLARSGLEFRRLSTGVAIVAV
jgi:hypothetical protein